MEAAQGAVAPADDSLQRAAGDAAHAAAAAAPVGFAKRRNRGSIRKRATDDGGEAADGGAAGGDGDGGGGVVRGKASKQSSSMAFSTKRGDRAEVFAFESSNAVQQARDGGATATNEQETAHDRDSRALREQVLRQVGSGEDGGGGAPVSGGDDGAYRGLNNYRDYTAGFRREHTWGAEKGAGTHGPLRAATNVRMTVRVDYQPDICKDYKETGYCGFGDACKFMHDRGDYKAGWELDRVRGWGLSWGGGAGSGHDV